MIDQQGGKSVTTEREKAVIRIREATPMTKLKAD